jgi:hypothetical protein
MKALQAAGGQGAHARVYEQAHDSGREGVGTRPGTAAYPEQLDAQ